jgi:hypothetical protein
VAINQQISIMKYVMQNTAYKDKYINQNKEWAELDDANIYFPEEILDYYLNVDNDVATHSNIRDYKNLLESHNGHNS